MYPVSRVLASCAQGSVLILSTGKTWNGDTPVNPVLGREEEAGGLEVKGNSWLLVSLRLRQVIPSQNPNPTKPKGAP